MVYTEPFIGLITLFGGDFAPRNWAFCDGQLLPIAQHQALFMLTGTTYGGDGRTTFALPDLRGRVAIGWGQGPGLSQRSLGAKGGSETETLTTNQIPSHTHITELLAYSTAGSSYNPTGNFIGGGGSKFSTPDPAANVAMSSKSVMVSSIGGSQAHNNIQPSLVISYIIALIGIYPSRS